MSLSSLGDAGTTRATRDLARNAAPSVLARGFATAGPRTPRVGCGALGEAAQVLALESQRPRGVRVQRVLGPVQERVVAGGVQGLQLTLEVAVAELGRRNAVGRHGSSSSYVVWLALPEDGSRHAPDPRPGARFPRRSDGRAVRGAAARSRAAARRGRRAARRARARRRCGRRAAPGRRARRTPPPPATAAVSTPSAG